ncbi:hypothetical protein PVAND_009061 [Polypedilum vanderplanki]|uniref:Ionotropic receptor n=1 Tax=Polypedilum vanderplanki TaxID=319348 RepID=A0A9J6CBH2_POLVA|nr:hypothetical protein PVAND_009061 [Polypedilum vanderplanki]
MIIKIVLGLSVFIHLFISLAFCVEILCQTVSYKALKETLDVEPTEPISKTIADVIDEFYIKNNIDFDFIIYGNKTNHINDVINGLKDNFPTIIKYIPNVNKWNHRFNKSAIFFVNSLDDLKILHEKSSYILLKGSSQFSNLLPKRFKFLVYIEEAESFELIENLTRLFPLKAVGIFTDLTFHEFLLFNDGYKIILAANVYYSEKKCGQIHLKKLNSFDTETQKWDNSLENFDHYANFHGCMISFRTYIQISFYVKDNLALPPSDEILSDDNVKFAGVINTLLEALAKKYNFTIYFSIFRDQDGEAKQIITTNYNTSIFSTFVLGTTLKRNIRERSFYYFSQSLYTYDFYFLVSYNDLYTNYEKLIFPFDYTTWILIFLTYGLTFGSIIVLRYCPRWLKKKFFGEGINNPAYNALGIFFGISQMRLPNESFCRSILLIYIWYCLIIRTCWQSMMFEFMTSDMRKPLPESIEDLINLDYKVITHDKNWYYEILNGRDGPEIEEHEESETKLLYKTALNGETKSKYAFFISSLVHGMMNSSYGDSLPTMKNERLTKQFSFQLRRSNIMTQPIDDTINELMPSGILQYDSDYSMWFFDRPVDFEIEDSRRILSMFDLKFGFVIFYGFLGLSIAVFIYELHVLYVKRQLRKLFGLKGFIKVLSERLKYYHDRWMEICYSKKRRKRDNKDYDLNVFKITFACLLLFLALCVEISCQNVKYKALKETLDLESTQTVSKSISDVIDEFYIKNYIGFDFIIYGNTTNHINDVINKLKTIPATIMQIPDIKKWDHKLNRSAIFFVKSLDEFSFIHEVFITFSMHVPQTINIEPKKFKLLIYVEGTDSFESVESKTRLFPYKYYGSISKLLFFEFIIFNDRNKIILVANVLFSEKLCGHIHLKKLNSFDKITLKWDKTLENFDQYANLHGCMINFDSGLGNDFYVKSFENLSIPNGNLYDSNFKFAGVTYILLEIVAAKHNFRIHYALIYDKNYQVRAIDYDLSSLYSFSFIKNTFQNPLFEQTPYFQDSQTLYTYDYYFLISYNDFYTNYEKLTFPFDNTSWILIFLTFSLTFTSIFGLHFCPRWFKEIVFGRGVIHPAYNALGIFFGISQIRLPRESFCRAIFIIYLWYCLIIRTCWQSKMFECITNDMRKPLPESIENLIDMNYKVKIKQGFKEKYEEILNGKNGPQIDVIEYDELKSLYKTALNGKIKTKYAFLLNTEIHAEFNSTFNDSLPIMKNERLTKPCTFTMMRYNIMTQPVDNIISKLMPSGILQHQSYYDIWYLYRPVEVEVKDSRRVLSMSDLEFGFVIFLGVLSLSIIVFICELHVLHVRRQLRKLLGLYEFIRVIRERLKDYHDRW